MCFASFCSTPVQGFSNIYWGVFHTGVRTKFIFKARSFTQQFFKLTSPDRNNIITGVLDFLQPRLSFLIPILQCFLSLADEYVSIGHAETPTPKSPEVLKDFISVCTVPINFHIRDPRQMKFPPVTGMNNSVTRTTNIRQPLKSLNRLAIPIR